VFILLLAAAVYAATKFVPPYWTYLSMQDPVSEAAMAATRQGGTEEKVRATLIQQAKEQGLNLTDNNIEFVRQGPMLVVRVGWVAPVDLPRYRHNIRFRIERRVPLP
jgi:hypothetical protein